MTDDVARKIHAARVRAGEEAAIAGIPSCVMDRMRKMQAEHKAKGGCPGCGSMVLAVHTMPCSECAKHPFD